MKIIAKEETPSALSRPAVRTCVRVCIAFKSKSVSFPVHERSCPIVPSLMAKSHILGAKKSDAMPPITQK